MLEENVNFQTNIHSAALESSGIILQHHTNRLTNVGFYSIVSLPYEKKISRPDFETDHELAILKLVYFD
jgi:hypothetical protein